MPRKRLRSIKNEHRHAALIQRNVQADSIIALSQRNKEFCNTIGGKADDICSALSFSAYDSAQAFDEPLLDHLLGVAAVSWPLPPDGKKVFSD